MCSLLLKTLVFDVPGLVLGGKMTDFHRNIFGYKWKQRSKGKQLPFNFGVQKMPFVLHTQQLKKPSKQTDKGRQKPSPAYQTIKTDSVQVQMQIQTNQAAKRERINTCPIFLDLLVHTRAQVVKSASNLTHCPQKGVPLHQAQICAWFSVIKIPFLYLRPSLS